MSIILGINAYHPGSSAALVIDGIPVCAIAEERLNRVKYFSGFPKLAIRHCLDATSLKLSDIDIVSVGRDPSANFTKKLTHSIRNIGQLSGLLKLRSSRGQLDNVKNVISKELDADPRWLPFSVEFVEHHLAHIASAYFASPWDHASGISIDGSGDFVSCMLASCTGDEISVLHRIHAPNSLGTLYTTICEFIGYSQYGDEGKVMGLAPLGEDTFSSLLNQMVATTKNGFKLDKRFFIPFGFSDGLNVNHDGIVTVGRHYSDYLSQLIGPPRQRQNEITKRESDLACSLQIRFEQVYIHLLNVLYEKAPSSRLVMAGGCALNSVANGKIFDLTPFEETFIQPASGDDGLALGSALYVSNRKKNQQRWVMTHPYLGGSFTDEEILLALEKYEIRYTKLERQTLLEDTAKAIGSGNIIGWFQGKMEWGPRALGNRSILAHPGLPDMKALLNSRIKYREPFRPFAPAVLDRFQKDLFDHSQPSPFMLHVYKIRPEWRERLCAVNHVDNTGRLQTISKEMNELFFDLITEFFKLTGIPVLLNTSFNENEPIVYTPDQAIKCFLRTKMDVLVIGSFFCAKPAASN